jgi:hypothetical protein
MRLIPAEASCQSRFSFSRHRHAALRSSAAWSRSRVPGLAEPTGELVGKGNIASCRWAPAKAPDRRGAVHRGIRSRVHPARCCRTRRVFVSWFRSGVSPVRRTSRSSSELFRSASRGSTLMDNSRKSRQQTRHRSALGLSGSHPAAPHRVASTGQSAALTQAYPADRTRRGTAPALG